jgi:hypothetical protein
MYVVSQHAGRHPLARFSLQEDGTFHLRGLELRGSSLGELLLRDILLPNVGNVERLKRSRCRPQDSSAAG